MKEGTFKVWVSKYALTKGVYEVEVKSTHCPTMVSVPRSIQSFHKPHWHLTKQEAIEQAEKMRKSKMSSLSKQIDNISRLKFE